MATSPRPHPGHHPSAHRLRRAVAAVGVLATAVVGAALPATAQGAAPTATSRPAAALTTTALTTTVPTAQPLSWAPPVLENPQVVKVSATNRDLRLTPGQDYVVQMPATPLTGANGLIIGGGRNVVLVGGEISIPSGVLTNGTANRGLYLKDQTGTVHVEGLRITGAGLGEGINLDERLGAVVQLQNVRVDTVRGTAAGHHADVVQAWAGPRQLRVDGLTGWSNYQGLFLLPQQYGTQAQPEVVDLRRVDLHGTGTSGHMVWRDTNAWPLAAHDVWVAPRYPAAPDTFLSPGGRGAGTQAWPSVRVGTPPAGEFVPAGTAGTGYVSPGYVAAGDPPAPLVAPSVAWVVGAQAAAGAHWTTASSVELTWSGAGPAATTYEVLRDGVVVAQVAAPATRVVAPVVPGTQTLAVRASAPGQAAVTSAPVTVVVDRTAPRITAGPTVQLRPGTLAPDGTAPLLATWAASDDLRLRDVALTSPVTGRYPAPKAEAYVNAAPGLRTWTLVATDEAGSTATVSAARTVTVSGETATQRTGTWTTAADAQHHGGAALHSSTAGSTITHAFTGSSVGLAALRTPTSGRVVVYVDGAKVTTLDLASTTTSYRQVAYHRSWPTVGPHTLRLVVEGTAGRPGVTVDGFVTVS